MKIPSQTGKPIRFLVFSDLHYHKDVYASSVQDLRCFFERATEAHADFLIQGGDFSNDLMGSPELIKNYLNNPEEMPVFGVMGNHDLKTKGNSLEKVTSALTNCAHQVTWGTEDGSFGSGSIAYYHFDSGVFRFIFLDSNYSYSPAESQWEHNPTGIDCAPAGNIHRQGLGPVQLEWLTSLLMDAAEKDMHCIVVSHESMNPTRSMYSSDAHAVQEIFSKVNAMKKGTVILAVNGHTHSNRPPEFVNDVLCFEVNVARNGYWIDGSPAHYAPDQNVIQYNYDTEGNLTSTDSIPVSSLKQGNATWFFDEPLSAVVTLDPGGTVTIEGMETRWMYDVAPEDVPYFIVPRISGGCFRCF